MTAASASLAAPVAEAIEHLRELFELAVEPTGDGGAVVTVHNIDVGEAWNPSSIDLTFEIAFNYPFAPIYPYYASPELRMTDGNAHPAGLQHVEWRGVPRMQISLRANRWNPQVDTATGATLQVQDWFQRR